MKSLLVIIGLAIIGYWLYTYYQQNPDSVPHFERLTAILTPTPTPPPPTPVPTQPPLDTIPVAKGPTLTHARVKAFSTTAVLFIADQGLVEYPYDRLPPGFAAYYLPRVPAPTPTPSPTPTPTPGPTAAATPKPFVEKPPSRSYQDDAYALQKYNDDIKNYQDRMAQDQALMDRHNTGSSFDRDTPTQDDYNRALDDYNKTQALLTDRLSKGP